MDMRHAILCIFWTYLDDFVDFRENHYPGTLHNMTDSEFFQKSHINAQKCTKMPKNA
jgi:hypothetical protein